MCETRTTDEWSRDEQCESPNSIDILIGRRIKTRRMELGFSEEQLGKKLGISGNGIKRFENARARFPVAHLDALARHLKVPYQYFFDVSVEERAEAALASEIRHLSIAGEVKELVRDYVQITNPGERGLIREIVANRAASQHSNK